MEQQQENVSIGGKKREKKKEQLIRYCNGKKKKLRDRNGVTRVIKVGKLIKTQTHGQEKLELMFKLTH